MFDRFIRTLDDLKKQNKHVEALLDVADFAQQNFKETLEKLSEADWLQRLKSNEKPEAFLKMKDATQASLRDVFASLSERDWLLRGKKEFNNFLDEEHGIFMHLIHPLEVERFAELKKNETLGLVLTVMGNTHAGLTSIAEVPDRSFIVTKETFPRLHNLYQEAYNKLELDREYNLFCTMDYGRNVKTLGTDDGCIIVIGSTCLEDFSDAQILALLGRELGHIKFKHIKYLRAFELIDYVISFLPSILSQFAEAAAVSAAKGLLLDWLLAAEYSAERAGAFVAGDILPVIQNNLMISGLETSAECVDFESYTQIDLPQNLNNFDRATKLLMTNTLRDFPIPFVIPRIKELVAWGASEKCKEIFPKIYRPSRYPAF